MVEYDDPDAVEAVLGGTASYDHLSEHDQAAVRDIWDRLVAESIARSDLERHFRATGQDYVEADSEGRLVTAEDRLKRDLEVVIERASRVWQAPDVVRDWLEGPNAHLGGARPVDVLRIRRDLEAVLQALEAAEQGGYA